MPMMYSFNRPSNALTRWRRMKCLKLVPFLHRSVSPMLIARGEKNTMSRDLVVSVVLRTPASISAGYGVNPSSLIEARVILSRNDSDI